MLQWYDWLHWRIFQLEQVFKTFDGPSMSSSIKREIWRHFEKYHISDLICRVTWLAKHTNVAYCRRHNASPFRARLGSGHWQRLILTLPLHGILRNCDVSSYPPLYTVAQDLMKNCMTHTSKCRVHDSGRFLGFYRYFPVSTLLLSIMHSDESPRP